MFSGFGAAACVSEILYYTQFARGVSTASAIQRGIGRSNAVPTHVRRNYNPLEDVPKDGKFQSRRDRRRRSEETAGNQSQRLIRTPRLKVSRPPSLPAVDHRGPSLVLTGSQKAFKTHSDVSAMPTGNRARPDRSRAPRARKASSFSADTRERKNPIPIPYTTSASEFLYGRSVVEAALKTGRRKLHKLYFNNSEKAATSRLMAEEPLIRLAHAKGVTIKSLRREDAGRLLDAMSGGRPHNGIVLEASPLPKLSCISLGPVSMEARQFNITRADQSPEDSDVNSDLSKITFDGKAERMPFLLLLDGILDPGNLGAILRSAFFLGVDAVVLSSHGAPLSAAALKASAGAAEMLPIITVRDTGRFIRASQRDGWRFYAAVPLQDGLDLPAKAIYSLASLNSPLRQNPCVAMLGGEGNGLWKDLRHKADCFVTIHGPRAGQAGVDSLNVSVSAALLSEAFMRRPSSHEQKNRLWDID